MRVSPLRGTVGIACLTVAFIAACEDLPFTPNSDPLISGGGAQSSVGTCTRVINSTYIDPLIGGLDCEATFTIGLVGDTPPSGFEGEVEAAVEEIGSVLDGSYDLPSVVYSDEGSYDLEVELVGTSGSYYYGSQGSGALVKIYRQTSSEPPSGTNARVMSLSEVNQVALHEILQKFGFKEKNNYPAVPKPALVGCAIEVDPAPAPMADVLCVHEEQALYEAFNLRGAITLDYEMYTGIDLSLSTLALDASEDTTVTTTLYDSGTGGGSSWVLGEGADIVSNNRGAQSSTLFWVTWQATGAVSLSAPTSDAGTDVVAAPTNGSGTIAATLAVGARTVWPTPDAAVIPVTVTGGAGVDSVSVSSQYFMISSTNPTSVITGTAYESDGTVIPGVTFEWSENSSYTAVSPSSGSGTTTLYGCSPYPTYASSDITATASGTSVSGTVTVTVHKNHPGTCPAGP